MKHATYFIARALFIILSLGFTTKAAMAQDLAVVNQANVKVLIENDQVRVLDVLNKQGDISPMHSHPTYVSVFLTDTKLKYITPDGKTVVKDRKAGEAVFSGPVTHSVENVGTTDEHVITIELKK